MKVLIQLIGSLLQKYWSIKFVGNWYASFFIIRVKLHYTKYLLFLDSLLKTKIGFCIKTFSKEKLLFNSVLNDIIYFFSDSGKKKSWTLWNIIQQFYCLYFYFYFIFFFSLHSYAICCMNSGVWGLVELNWIIQQSKISMLTCFHYSKPFFLILINFFLN